MKTSVVHFVVSIAALCGLFAQASACGPGGNGRPAVCHTNNGPYSPYPPNYPPPYPPTYPSPYSPTGPVYSNVASQYGSSVPTSHLTVVPTTSDSAVKASTVSTESAPTAKIHEVSNTEKVAEPVATKTVDAAAVKEETSKIADSIKGLVGKWMAVARHDGELTTVELQLDDRGWAKLTVPGADGKPSTTERKVEFENDELKLISDGASDISLGKLVEFDSRQMVLDRAGGQVTFVRP